MQQPCLMRPPRSLSPKSGRKQLHNRNVCSRKFSSSSCSTYLKCWIGEIKMRSSMLFSFFPFDSIACKPRRVLQDGKGRNYRVTQLRSRCREISSCSPFFLIISPIFNKNCSFPSSLLLAQEQEMKIYFRVVVQWNATVLSGEVVGTGRLTNDESERENTKVDKGLGFS